MRLERIGAPAGSPLTAARDEPRNPGIRGTEPVTALGDHSTIPVLTVPNRPGLCKMTVVTLASKFQFVLPKAAREELAVEPGQQFTIVTRNGVIELVPLRRMEDARGMLKRAVKAGYRDRHDRF